MVGNLFDKGDLTAAEIAEIEQQYRREGWKTERFPVKFNGVVHGEELILYRDQYLEGVWVENHRWDIS